MSGYTDAMGGRLTDDEYLCSPCHVGHHDLHSDLFILSPFGLLACSCPECES